MTQDPKLSIVSVTWRTALKNNLFKNMVAVYSPFAWIKEKKISRDHLESLAVSPACRPPRTLILAAYVEAYIVPYMELK